MKAEPSDIKESRKYLYNIIIEKLMDLIKNGNLKPGDRLPPERKLAEDFGVSRNSIRQAIQALVERKVLESRQGDGTYISASPVFTFSADCIAESINERQGLLGDIIEFRKIVEPWIASLAAKKIKPEEISWLKMIVCDQHMAILYGRNDNEIDREFHMKLAELSGNRVVIEVMTAIQSIINESRSEWLQSRERKTASVEGHLKIIEALSSGNSEDSFRAMLDHLSEIEDYILGDS